MSDVSENQMSVKQLAPVGGLESLIIEATLTSELGVAVSCSLMMAGDTSSIDAKSTIKNHFNDYLVAHQRVNNAIETELWSRSLNSNSLLKLLSIEFQLVSSTTIGIGQSPFSCTYSLRFESGGEATAIIDLDDRFSIVDIDMFMV